MIEENKTTEQQPEPKMATIALKERLTLDQLKQLNALGFNIPESKIGRMFLTVEILAENIMNKVDTTLDFVDFVEESKIVRIA